MDTRLDTQCRGCSSARHSAARPGRNYKKWNDTPASGLSLENDLLRTPRAGRSPHGRVGVGRSRISGPCPCAVAYNYDLRSRISSPLRPSFFSPSSSMYPVVVADERSAGRSTSTMICNFDNQSHERRLIFIITHAASASSLGMGTEARCNQIARSRF